MSALRYPGVPGFPIYRSLGCLDWTLCRDVGDDPSILEYTHFPQAKVLRIVVHLPMLAADLFDHLEGMVSPTVVSWREPRGSSVNPSTNAQCETRRSAKRWCRR